MKRFLTVAACAAGVALPAVEALAMPLPVVSVRGGLSVANVRADYPVLDPGTKLGFAGGLSATFRATPLLSVQPEVLYSMKGFSFGESEATDQAGNPIGTSEALHAVDYLEIPVLARLELPVAGPLRPSLLAGPSVAFEVSERFVVKGAGEGSADVDDFRNTDFGMVTGLGIEVPIGPAQWLLDARYTFGLSQLARSGPVDVRNGAFLVTTGWSFGPRP